jgi:ATP-dependent helicase IRC3
MSLAISPTLDAGVGRGLAPLALRDYQEEALAEIERLSAELRRQLVVLPTGTGKTVIFSHLLQRRPGRGLVLAHRDELLGQATSKIKQVLTGAQVGRVQADLDQVDAPIVVASVQTLARENRLARLPRDFTTVICDEAHHAAAASYMRIFQHVGVFADAGPLLVGFTATPDRGDRIGLDQAFQKIVFKRNLLEMVEAGYLADLRAVQVRLAADFRALHSHHGDFSEHELENLLLDANAPQHAVRAFQTHASNRKALVFTPTVAVAKAMAAAFQEAGFAAESLDGNTPTDERRAILRRLSDGTTQVLANCAVLTEGFDEPSVDCVVIARPTKSRGLYQQMLGRGTRLYPGKTDLLLLDLVGSTTRHDLVTASSLFGVEPKALATTTLTQVKARAAASGYQGEMDIPGGEFVTRVIDAFRGRSLQWVKAGSAFALRIDSGWLRIEPRDADTWDVVQHERDRLPVRLAEGLGLGYAQGLAEDFARKHGTVALLDSSASWRKRPATTKQRETLQKLRIRVPDDITSGDASDAISAAMARRAAQGPGRRW